MTPGDPGAYYILVATFRGQPNRALFGNIKGHFFREVGGGILGASNPSAAEQIRTKKVKEQWHAKMQS